MVEESVCCECTCEALDGTMVPVIDCVAVVVVPVALGAVHSACSDALGVDLTCTDVFGLAADLCFDFSG